MALGSGSDSSCEVAESGPVVDRGPLVVEPAVSVWGAVSDRGAGTEEGVTGWVCFRSGSSILCV